MSLISGPQPSYVLQGIKNLLQTSLTSSGRRNKPFANPYFLAESRRAKQIARDIQGTIVSKVLDDDYDEINKAILGIDHQENEKKSVSIGVR